MHNSIPKIIHQIWIGPYAKPVDLGAVANLFPDYEYKLWRERDLPILPPLVSNQIVRYANKSNYAYQADILRYFLLKEYGGIYIDADISVKKDFTHLLTKPFNVICSTQSGVNHITNGIFACEPQTPLLTDIVDNLQDEVYHGPIFFTRYIKKLLSLPMMQQIPCKIIYEQSRLSNYINCIESSKFFNKYAENHAFKTWIW